MKLTKLANILIISIASIIILIYGKDLIIPFILALIIWFIIKELRDLISKINFVKNNLPRWLLSTISSILVFFILGLGRAIERGEELVDQ
jgi:predicted PurR-regulated permease PerM